MSENEHLILQCPTNHNNTTSDEFHEYLFLKSSNSSHDFFLQITEINELNHPIVTHKYNLLSQDLRITFSNYLQSSYKCIHFRLFFSLHTDLVQPLYNRWFKRLDVVFVFSHKKYIVISTHAKCFHLFHFLLCLTFMHQYRVSYLLTEVEIVSRYVR